MEYILKRKRREGKLVTSTRFFKYIESGLVKPHMDTNFYYVGVHFFELRPRSSTSTSLKYTYLEILNFN